MLKLILITVAIGFIIFKDKKKRDRSKLENIRKEEFIRRNLKWDVSYPPVLFL